MNHEDLRQLGASRALARLSSNPRVGRRVAGPLRELLEVAAERPKAGELSDSQRDRIALALESLRAELTARKELAQIEVRRWELRERELNEMLEAATKRTKSSSS